MARGEQSKRNRIKKATKRLHESGYSMSNPPPPAPKCLAWGAYSSILDLSERIGRTKDQIDVERMTRAKAKAGTKFNFYSTQLWREARYQALAGNDGRCELCGHSKHDGARLHVDHIKPRSKFPELELRVMNLQVLCEDCNLGKSNKDYSDWRKASH